MKNLWVLSFVALILSACAGMHSFDGDLRQSLIGAPVNDAVLRLGEKPHSQYEAQNGTVYVWRGRITESVVGPIHRAGIDMYDFHGLKLSGLQSYSCVIRAATSGGMIQSLSLEENPGGCAKVYGTK